MAGSDSYKQLLFLIREYASEKSQGERRVVGLRKRIEELQSELEVANAELENVKRTKETTEQELKGCEVQLSLNETSIQTLEARIAVLQGEIASVGSELEGLKKSEDGSSRDQFIDHMLDLNDKIRKFQDKLSCNTGTESVGNVIEESSELEGDDTKVSSRPVEEMLISLIAQLNKEEEEYEGAQNSQNQVRKELFDLEKKLTVMETIMKETKELQDLTSSGLEETFARLSKELQNSCVCPKCKQDNMEALDNIPQVNEAN